MKILEVNDLSVRINERTIIENITFSVEKGEIIAIVGPNGGGKTTLIKSILGFIQPYKGYIKLLGKPPGEAVKTGKIGYLPQKSSVPKDFPFSVLDVVMLGLINKKIPKEKKLKKAREYLKYVGMERFENKPYSSLSGGQQQRVSIARVLVSDPEIIFLDEPSTGIDVVAQESFYDFLQRLKKEKNMTIVMVSHDIGVVGRFVDKVAGLNRFLHFYGHPKEFFKKEVLENIYGAEVELIIHSPECVACEHFHIDFK
ncbi:MAG TPA: metal ABC transporter ATP-binding protein [Persephonella sp.]|uniref:Manganese transport system ATP-binding protein MntA n=1 Tax=Persephonella marina (strain DSM 14350 / EX-H1) TaxID=123214 RepID=C0QU88_PERMH|nr:MULTISPECIES: metal ABC transporter ATP-binding protein [Persephonella]ACO04663.1 manganese transport system ATP-binding protein MntA [Persephonella marina EX-H1]HCB70132.1 metal ABC transporter ATP-binding protein [Persephonella sp.]